jgi:precorrin-6B methylase 2
MSATLAFAVRKALNPARRAASRLLERLLGVRTSGDIRQIEQGYEYGIYRPTPWLVLRALLDRLEIAENDVFVDIGSGMGRVVLMAARRPFGRVIGIERSPELTEIARENLARGRGRLRCQDVELLTVDALDWEVPDDVTVIYLNCPFPDEVLERVLAKLVESLDTRPRAMRLIYNFSTAQNREAVMATGRARRIELGTPWYLREEFREVSLYRLVPATAQET